MDKHAAEMYACLGKLVVDSAKLHSQIIEPMLIRLRRLENGLELVERKLGLRNDADAVQQEIDKFLTTSNQEINRAISRWASHTDQVEGFLETVKKYASEQPEPPPPK